jgi:hypothetical protein
MKHKKIDPVGELYKELKKVDEKFGGRKIRKVESDTHKKRPVKNYKKAWEEHETDYEEYDDFFGD